MSIQFVDVIREYGVILFIELCYWSVLVVEKLKSSLEILRRIGLMVHLLGIHIFQFNS